MGAYFLKQILFNRMERVQLESLGVIYTILVAQKHSVPPKIWLIIWPVWPVQPVRPPCSWPGYENLTRTGQIPKLTLSVRILYPGADSRLSHQSNILAYEYRFSDFPCAHLQAAWHAWPETLTGNGLQFTWWGKNRSCCTRTTSLKVMSHAP